MRFRVHNPSKYYALSLAKQASTILKTLIVLVILSPKLCTFSPNFHPYNKFFL